MSFHLAINPATTALFSFHGFRFDASLGLPDPNLLPPEMDPCFQVSCHPHLSLQLYTFNLSTLIPNHHSFPVFSVICVLPPSAHGQQESFFLLESICQYFLKVMRNLTFWDFGCIILQNFSFIHIKFRDNTMI